MPATATLVAEEHASIHYVLQNYQTSQPTLKRRLGNGRLPHVGMANGNRQVPKASLDALFKLTGSSAVNTDSPPC